MIAPPIGGDADRGAQTLGRDFLFAVHGAMRALKLYPLENRAVQNALGEVEDLSGRICSAEGSVLLRYVGDFCFVNDLRLRIELASFATFGAVGAALAGHGIGQLEVEPGATREEWVATLTALQQDPPAENAFERISERLDRSRVTNIHVSPELPEQPEVLPDDQSRAMAKKTYAESVAVAREALTGVRMGKGMSVRRVKRAVQQVVDQVLHNESSMISMTVLRDYDQYTFAHSVNVCIFAIALGKKLGLSRMELYELGMGALVHDLGKARMPIELTNKTGQLADPEWELIKEHPTEGLLTLMEMRGLGDFPLRAMLIAYEHHMKVDQTGYPPPIRPREISMFSKIVAVADSFDAATTRRSYQSEPWTPAMVLKEMRDNVKRGMDPVIVKSFINLTGIYPVGSVVILDSYELAVVVAPSTLAEVYHQPVVKIIYDELGIPLSPPRMLDLTEVDPATGAPVRTIVKTTDPETYGIRVRDYIV
ncbi:MAG: HD domain-containing protein [Gemmatimonadetes bacterium]|nr:HD domain-containing protein [Gemmatimonadota bacterium]